MTPCKPHQGYISPKGYGHVSGGLAHRVAYEREVGPIPEGMQLDHLCRNRSCTEVTHLEPVTSRENTLRGETIPARWAARTECEKCGGELTPCPTGRVCRPCRTQRVNDNRRARREKEQV